MNNDIEKNNRVYICGTVESDAAFSYELNGEGFYELFVKINRPSGQADILPVIVPERFMDRGIMKGAELCALGQFRSFRTCRNGKSKLILNVLVREVLDYHPCKTPNSIVLSGCICKPRVYHTTSTDREIADFLITVRRSFNKSDSIPVIAFDSNAQLVKNLAAGDRIALVGRIQSREYKKKQPDDSFVTMTAYEVSASKIVTFDGDSDFDIDKEFDLYHETK